MVRLRKANVPWSLGVLNVFLTLRDMLLSFKRIIITVFQF